MAKNRVKTSFTLSVECIEGLKHLSAINNRSMSNYIETMVAKELKKRKTDFFAHMNKRHSEL